MIKDGNLIWLIFQVNTQQITSQSSLPGFYTAIYIHKLHLYLPWKTPIVILVALVYWNL